jgi:hypothetical protein
MFCEACVNVILLGATLHLYFYFHNINCSNIVNILAFVLKPVPVPAVWDPEIFYGNN